MTTTTTLNVYVYMPDTTFYILEEGKPDLEMQEERKGDGEEKGKERKKGRKER